MRICQHRKIGFNHRFGWWNAKHALENIANPKKWVFEYTKCQAHVEDEAVADLFKCDETVTYEEEALYVGRIGREDAGGIQLKTLRKPNWLYKELFEERKVEILAPRRTFDHPINLQEWAEPL